MLYKSTFYFVVVVVVMRVLEKLIEYAVHGGTLAGTPDYVVTHFTWHRFLAIQIWILVLFLVYTFITELNTLFGDGELHRILFTWRSSDLKLTRADKAQPSDRGAHDRRVARPGDASPCGDGHAAARVGGADLSAAHPGHAGAEGLTDNAARLPSHTMTGSDSRTADRSRMNWIAGGCFVMGSDRQTYFVDGRPTAGQALVPLSTERSFAGRPRLLLSVITHERK